MSQRKDKREAISLGLAIPTNATAFRPYGQNDNEAFSSFILCKHARLADAVIYITDVKTLASFGS